jgi:hypothetical protein
MKKTLISTSDESSFNKSVYDFTYQYKKHIRDMATCQAYIIMLEKAAAVDYFAAYNEKKKCYYSRPK